MTSVMFTIPGRVDTNHRPRASLRGGKIRTHKAARYRDYVARAHLCAQARMSALGLRGTWPLDARYEVTITVYEHDRRSRDLDNACKGILDALTAIAWADDRQIDALHVLRGEVRRSAPCVVVVVEALR